MDRGVRPLGNDRMEPAPLEGVYPARDIRRGIGAYLQIGVTGFRMHQVARDHGFRGRRGCGRGFSGGWLSRSDGYECWPSRRDGLGGRLTCGGDGDGGRRWLNCRYGYGRWL